MPAEAEALARGLAARSPSRLGAALRITERVNRETALIEALNVLVAGVSEALAADSAGVLLLEDSIDGPVLVMFASRGRAAAEGPALRIPLGRGVLGRIGERRETLTIDDLRELGDVPSILASDGLTSFLGVPVADQGRLVAQMSHDELQRTVRRYRAEVPDGWQEPPELRSAVPDHRQHCAAPGFHPVGYGAGYPQAPGG